MVIPGVNGMSTPPGGLLWPHIPPRNKTTALSLLVQFEQSQWWSPERLLENQLRQIQLLVSHARTTVPYYRHKLDSIAGLAPGKLTLDRWRKIPLLERTDIQEAGDELETNALPESHGKTHVIRTSGSTGRPVVVKGTTLTGWFRSAMGIRYHFWHRRDLSCKSVTITSMKPGVLEKRHVAWAWGMKTGPSLTLNKSLPDEVLLQQILAVDPEYLQLPPSTLRGLIFASMDLGRKPEKLREARVFSEPLDPGLRELCQREWGIKVTENYSSMEFTIMALECPEEGHMHVQAENCLVEVLDGRGRPCEPGQVGEVVVTSLNNYATPLIRYRNGDMAEVGPLCSCGRGLPVLTRVAGRTRNQILLPSGERVTPSFVGEPILNELPIRQIQLVQRNRKALEARLSVSRSLTKEDEARISSYFNRSWGHDFSFNFVYVDSIPRLPGGKYESVRCELDAHGARMTAASRRVAGIQPALGTRAWPASLEFVSHGGRFRIGAEGESLLEGLQSLLPPRAREKEVEEPDVMYTIVRSGRGIVVCRGFEQLGKFRSLARAHAFLASDFHFQVALNARRRLFVHAGTVGWMGNAIVIPGRTFSGKSTLVNALVRRGATYFSDEYAVLDTDGRVHSYPKPISLRTGKGGAGVRLVEAGGKNPGGPLPLGLVLTTKYRKGARWRPRERTPAEAMLSLLNNTVVARLRPKLAMRILGKAVSGTAAMEGDRGDASRVAVAILDYLSSGHGKGDQ